MKSREYCLSPAQSYKEIGGTSLFSAMEWSKNLVIYLQSWFFGTFLSRKKYEKKNRVLQSSCPVFTLF